MKKKLLEVKQFAVEEKRQKVVQIESMIDEFTKMAGDLQEQIDTEQKKAGIEDVNHYAYPTFAKAALQRRENLLGSIEGLNAQLDGAREELNGALEEMKKIEITISRDDKRAFLANRRREQRDLDEISLRRLTMDDPLA